MITLRIALLLTIFLQLSVFAQKNVTDVTKSELTGISLPVGSKQDKRILMTASAKALLDMKAKEIGRECSGSTEVIFLPAGVNEKQSDVVKKTFTEGGYKISEDQGDKKYSLILKGDKSWLLYLDDTRSGADLYVSLLAPVPVTSSQPALKESASPPAAAVTNAAVQTAAPASQVAIQNNAGNTKAAVNETSSPAAAGAFKFTTTNFDDGWVAVETADYVKVSKGNIVSRIYFTVTMTDQMRPPVTEPHYYFWDLLVVPSFTIVNKWEWTEPLSYFSNYYIYAEAIDKSTGRNCFIGLDITLNSGGATPVLVIAPDKTTYEVLFQHPNNIKKMTGYNRFAISLSDLTGTWSGSDGSAANYYDSVTGNYAGMGFVSMSDQFTFASTGDYSSKHSGASGMVGSMNTYNQEYKGKATVSNWEIILNNRWKGETDTFEAWFEAVKGGRVLKLVNKTATGIKYNLVKISK